MAEMRRDRSGVTLLACGLGVLVFGPLVANYLGEPFYIRLFTRIAVMAIAAVSLDLILGYGGMVSFGHAAFVGIGAYVTGILAAHAASGEPLATWPIVVPGSDNAFVVWPSRWEFQVGKEATQVDCRQSEASNRIGSWAVFHSCDDTISLPIFQPTRTQVTETAFLQENGPWPVFAYILGDAEEQSSPKRAGRFNQQGDARTVGVNRRVFRAHGLFEPMPVEEKTQLELRF